MVVASQLKPLSLTPSLLLLTFGATLGCVEPGKEEDTSPDLQEHLADR